MKAVDDKKIVIYESRTGNTERIAREIADALKCGATKADEVSSEQIKDCELVVFGSPVHYACPSSGIVKLLEELKVADFRGFYAVFCTYGAPWREFSAESCLAAMEKFGQEKCLGTFYCPGLHEMFETFKGRPCQEDLDKARLFAEDILETFWRVSSS